MSDKPNGRVLVYVPNRGETFGCSFGDPYPFSTPGEAWNDVLKQMEQRRRDLTESINYLMSLDVIS